MNTICWIASLTKPVTATAAMTLVDQGRLQLDDPVEKYLPSFRMQTTADGRHFPITVRQLMCHASGIQSSVPLRPTFFFEQPWYRRSLTEVAEAIAKTQLRFEPGRRVQYSNAAPYVLGRIIEIQAEQPFGDYVREKVLRPLGMTDTDFAVPRQKIDRASVVYRRENNEPVVYCRFDPSWNVRMTMPDGGLFSTPRDVARFAESFLDDQDTLLSKDCVDMMLQEQAGGYGLSWILDAPGQFSHWGSSGTRVWADRTTGVVGVVFFQIQDQKRVDLIQRRFREAVSRATSEPQTIKR
jgi:CubicO group peptidase (beta-lactamase class C family)